MEPMKTTEPSSFCLHQQTIETKQALYPDEQKCFILILSDWSIQCYKNIKKNCCLNSETQIKSCDYKIMPFIPHFAITPFWISVDHLAAPEDEIRACLANSDKVLVSHPKNDDLREFDILHF